MISKKKIQFKFFDIDKIIEDEQNMKISENFEKKGENFSENMKKN